MKSQIPPLYNKYFVQKQDERRELFRLLRDLFRIEKGLYPGSFTHVAPSFYIPEMVYVDMDKRCPQFFSDETTRRFINESKDYSVASEIRFYYSDFSMEIPEKEGRFDLLISLYSGFISRYCKQYLRKDGILLANNSHGDSSLAHLDEDFKFIGVIKRNGERFRFNDDNLDSYFITKTGKPIDKNAIEKNMRGPEFTKTAYAYVFRKRN